MCRRLGYLDDVEEGRRRSESLKKRGYGPRYIAAKLKSVGLTAPAISFSEQRAAIAALLQKEAWRKKEKKKMIQALERRGFDLQCILESLL